MNEHVTVLADEAVEALNIEEGATVVDATLGAGGHAQKIVSRLNTAGTFVGIDVDPLVVKKIHIENPHNSTVHLLEGNFRNVEKLLGSIGIKKANGILADLGWRMEQFADLGKGFSFQKDEPLLMTFGDPSDHSFTAKDIVNEWEEEDIKNVLKGYGEERFAGRIAQRIVEERQVAPIETTGQLAMIVKNAVPPIRRFGKTNPATKTFQALRIAVNDELDALQEFIHASIGLLEKRGRLAIITFHSLEDRIVKHTFKAYARDQIGILVTKKPIVPTEEELQRNKRARSAKLRIIEKT